jgi:hypothetical protein
MSATKLADQFERSFRQAEAESAPIKMQRFWRGLFEAARILSELKPYQRESLITEAESVSLECISHDVAAEYLFCPKPVVELLTALTWLADRYVEPAEQESSK